MAIVHYPLPLRLAHGHQRISMVTVETNAPVFVRSSHRRCSIKKLFLKFCKIHRKTPVPESLCLRISG